MSTRETLRHCTCWLGTNATSGDSERRKACAVHGERREPRESPCSNCGNEVRDHRGILVCRCPEPASSALPVSGETLEGRIQQVEDLLNRCSLYGPADALRDSWQRLRIELADALASRARSTSG